MTPDEEIARLRSAIHTAHDHLHAGRVKEAHEALHCGVEGEIIQPKNITLNDAAQLHHLISRFNHICGEVGITACVVAFIPSSWKRGAHSVQIGGNVDACRLLEGMIKAAPSNYAGGP